MKEFAPRGANSFFQEWIPIEKGGKNINGRVASPASVSVTLRNNMTSVCNVLYLKAILDKQGSRIVKINLFKLWDNLSNWLR